jgi:acetyl/propionyl-CoA carboxylase alpha subunit
VDNARIDTALCDGYTVGLDYEPLMAKVMAWGEDRERAVRTLQRALLELRLEGVKNNVELLRSMLASKEFTTATHHTGSVPNWVEELRQRNLAHHSGIPPHLQHATARTDGTPASSVSEKEIAAAIGVTLAMAMQEQSKVDQPSAWRVHRRRDQLYSGSAGSRGWR